MCLLSKVDDDASPLLHQHNGEGKEPMPSVVFREDENLLVPALAHPFIA